MTRLSRRGAKMGEQEFENELVGDIGDFYDDPLGFVHYAFKWGEGELAGHKGPDEWQAQQLMDVGDAFVKDPETSIREAIASGHGIGKSTQVAWIILWAMSTRPHLNGVVTANTTTQLSTKTWRELALWHKRAINSHWFKWTATRFFHKDHPETWFTAAIPNTEHNAEAFAGLHAEHVLVIYDEACHDDKTDVLTENGWMRFAELTGEEALLTMCPNTQHTFYEKPIALTRAPYVGKMYEVDRRGASFCVTPKHKMLFRSYAGRQKIRRTDWKLEAIEQMSVGGKHFIQKRIGQRKTDIAEYFTLEEHNSERKSYPSVELNMDKWLDFLGWYFSEGHVQKTLKNIPCGVVLSQSSESIVLDWLLENFQYIADAVGAELKKLGKSQWGVYSPVLAKYLTQFGKNSLDKSIPDFIRKLPSYQIKKFLESFIAGDGYWREKNAVMYTSSKKMANQLHELALLCGGVATLTTREPSGEIDFGTHKAFSDSIGYVIYWNPDSLTDITIGAGRGKGQLIDYSGIVYCATMSSHSTLFTRRNGRCMWSGNSGIPDVIWEVSEGCMTTPKAMWFVFGNPTRNTGRFKSCFEEDAGRWKQRQIDSRTCKMTNKKELQELIDTYGEDSDFARVRIKGMFPRAGSMQFIPNDMVDLARLVTIDLEVYSHMPIVLGVDVARYGDDKNVVAVRQGRKLLGLHKWRETDLMETARRVSVLIDQYRPMATFVDGVGLGAGVVDRLRQLSYDVIEVNAGSTPADEELFFNKRAEMWYRMREWLGNGADIPQDPELRKALIGIEYGFDEKDKYRLERKQDMKKRGEASPDEGDAVSHTFAENLGDYTRQSFEPEESFEPDEMAA